MPTRCRLIWNRHRQNLVVILLVLLVVVITARYASDDTANDGVLLRRSDVTVTMPNRTDVTTKPPPAVVPVNLSWAKARESALASGGPTKVLLFSYMRGGSSTAGEMFNQDSRAAMWYEPGTAFYSSYFGLGEENFPQHDLYFTNMTRRILGPHETSKLVGYYSDMLDCRLESLPPETLAHYFVSMSAFLKNYTSCMGPDVQMDYSVNKCVRLITPLCGTTVESALQQNCHLIIETTRSVFIDNPGLFKDLLAKTTDFFEFNAETYQLTALLSDRLTNLAYFSPMIMTRLKWFIQHRLCLETVRTRNERCLQIAQTPCTQSSIRVVQVNRLNMESVGPILRANPDLHVIHVVRDPRAIAHSRIKTDHLIWDLTNKTTAREARIVCHKMREDLEQVRALQGTYPGAFIHMKYEDLVQDPGGVAQYVYSQLGEQEHSPAWDDWAQRTMHAKASGGPYDNVLMDAVSNADKWMSDVPKEQLDEIASFCTSVLELLGYPIV